MLARARATRALIVLSTSYLDEVAACDRLVYLDDGRVVATGTPDGAARRASPLELYRAWGDDPRAIARAARALPYVARRARQRALRARRGAARPRAGRARACSRDLARAARRPSRFAEHGAGRHGGDAARARAARATA